MDYKIDLEFYQNRLPSPSPTPSRRPNPIRNSPSLCNLLRRPLTSSPIKRPTFIDHMIHSPNCFLNRRLQIRSMTINHIDILHIQSFQRSFSPLDDMFPG
ncbi:unnamed protein product [Lactuca virosa]|uniref:Uncharacterized protein n=1 Tax=Lactuca virosa TaxID=75947 RepID=A0AAU9NSN5_9ASTR|nr:unnamed protein product [Lactuca virosa]